MCSSPAKRPVTSVSISSGCALYTKCSHYDETSSVFLQLIANTLFLIGAYVSKDEMTAPVEGGTLAIGHPIALSVVCGRHH